MPSATRTLLRLILLGAALLSSCAVHADAINPFVSFSSYSYSQPIAVHALFDDWNGDFKGGSVAVSSSTAAAGIRYGGWRLSRLERLDYQAQLTEDTAKFIYLTKNRLPLPLGKTFELEMSIHHLYSRGVNVGYEFRPSPRLRALVSFSGLEGLRMTSGTVRGEATATGENTYDFNLDVDYFYSKDLLFWRENAEPEGQGQSVDLGLLWQPSDTLTTRLSIRDIAGKIRWYNAPYTAASGRSNNRSVDENGYQRYDPLVSGTEGYADHIQELPLVIDFRLDQRVNNKSSYFAEYTRFGDLISFTRVGISTITGIGLFSVGTDLTHGGLMASYGTGAFYLKLQGDSWDSKDMRTVSLSLGWGGGT